MKSIGLGLKTPNKHFGADPKDPIYNYQVCAEQGQHTPGEIVKCLKSLWVVHLMNIRLNLSWLPITGKSLKQSYSTQQRWRNIKIIPWLLGLSLLCSCSWIPNNLNIQYNESAIIITHKCTPATGAQGSCIIRGLEEADSQIKCRTHWMGRRHLPPHQDLTFNFLREVPIHNTTLFAFIFFPPTFPISTNTLLHKFDCNSSIIWGFGRS